MLTALGTIGSALTPTLAAHHPLALIALEARDRNLLLVSPHVSLVPFLLVGTLRKFSSDPLFYLLGRWYGDAAVRWIEQRGGGSSVRMLERAFKRAAYPMLVIFPGAIVCALAGEAEIAPTVFFVVTFIRTIVVVFLLKVLGHVFQGPLDAVLEAFNRYALPLTAVSVVLVAVLVLRERRSGAGGLATLEPAAGPGAGTGTDLADGGVGSGHLGTDDRVVDPEP